MNIIKFLIIFSLTFQFQSYCGIKQIPTKIKNAIWWTLSNKYVQKYGSDVLFIISEGILDAKTDGYIWENLYGDKITYGINEKNWHFYKNVKRVCQFGSYFLSGLAIGQKHIGWRETFERKICCGLISWSVWGRVYARTRTGDYWNTDYGNKMIYGFNPFNNFKELYITPKDNQVYILDALRVSSGIIGLSYLEIKLCLSNF